MSRTRVSSRAAPSARSSRFSRPGPGASDVEGELQRLWSSYLEAGSPNARESLLLHYSPLVKYVASRVATGLPSAVEQADLVSYGIFGLMDALEKFDLSRGTKFETYAIQRIRGAIIDELRSLDWVPRSIRMKARQLEKAQEELEVRLKRTPTDAEVARRLGIDVPELHRLAMQVSFASVAALEEVVGAEAEHPQGVALLDTLSDLSAVDPTSGLEEEESRELLAAAVRALSERERKVITLYYFEGMTLAQAGEVLGVSESRVCQIHAKAVTQLRQRLAEQDEGAV